MKRVVILESNEENLLHYKDIIETCLSECNDYLSQYGLSVVFNYKYDFSHFPYMAVYQNRSVKNGGKIRVGINIDLLKEIMKEYGISESRLKVQIVISIWHEVGHGLIEWLKMLRRHDTQNKTGIFKGEMLKRFKNIINNEEECVEQFGAVQEGYSPYSLLEDFIDDYDAEIKRASKLKSLNPKRGADYIKH